MDSRMRDALAVTVEALDPPQSDAALVALAEVTAETIDEMVAGQRGMMLGQTAPLLLKLLQELEDRARKRRGPRGEAGPGKVAQLRAAHAQVKTRSRRAS